MTPTSDLHAEVVFPIKKSLHLTHASPLLCCTPGESVEENANVVVKLLIRRPECFGPALRGEGGQGLLVGMNEAIKISEDPALDLPKIPAVVAAGYGSTPALLLNFVLVMAEKPLNQLLGHHETLKTQRPPPVIKSAIMFVFV